MPLAATTRVGAIAWIAIAELLGMSLWFTASAVAPDIAAEWSLSERDVSWLTLTVQFGFVAGTLLSATLNLPDVLSVRRLFAVSAFVGATANAVIAFGVDSLAPALVLRFITGMALAGVYPPGMKLVATWFRSGRGIALGILVGALTLGKASPYLINAAGADSWRSNMIVASMAAVASGVVILFFVTEGPHSAGRAPFDIRQATEVFRNRAIRLANIGYFGHMWELYAMWTWLPVMIRMSAGTDSIHSPLAESAVFIVLGSGAIGCIAGGALADRIGRTVVTSGAMIISAACCIAIGFAYGAGLEMVMIVAAIWGASVIADSAQFSACVTELSDQRYVGTALTMQTCIGFLLTTASIHMIPWLVGLVGWKLAFVALAPGPIVGTIAMLRLRQLPEAAVIAGGRR